MCGSPIPVLVQSMAYVCSIAGVTGSNPAGGMDVRSLVFVVCCVGSSLCDGLITPSEESYRECACVAKCV